MRDYCISVSELTLQKIRAIANRPGLRTRISSGMKREMEYGARSARGPGREIFAVYDLTGLRAEIPQGAWIGEGQACPMPWGEWAECFRR